MKYNKFIFNLILATVAFLPLAVSAQTGTNSMRYIKVDTTEQGWVSWKEIEVYDSSGNKITGITATASAVYNGLWQAPPVPPQVPANVLDGDINTVWNAGETNPACMVSYGLQCPFSSRSAWIQLDLGSVKTVSKIVLVENGATVSEVSNLSASTDGQNFTPLTTFTAPIHDGERLQWPAPSYSGDPSVILTVNGTRGSVDVKEGTSISYAWFVTNADYLKATYSAVRDPSITGTTYASSYCDGYNSAQGTDVVQGTALTPFVVYPRPYFNTPEVWLLNDTKTIAANQMLTCRAGYKFTITLTAFNRYTGKSSSDTVIIRVFSSGATLPTPTPAPVANPVPTSGSNTSPSAPQSTYAQNLINILTGLVDTYKSMLGATGDTSTNTNTTGTFNNVNAPESTYAQNLMNSISNLSQTYQNMLNSTGGSVGTNNNTPVTPGPSGTNPTSVTISASVLNVRSAPNTQAVVLSQLTAGSSVTVACYVTGENIEGSSTWLRTSDNTYIWAGGTAGGSSLGVCNP